MRGTHVNIRWKAGAELAPLLHRIQAFAARYDLGLMPPAGRKPGCVEPWGKKPYKFHWWNRSEKKGRSSETDDPTALAPLEDSEFGALYWELYNLEGRCWFCFSITKDPDSPEESVKASRVYRLFTGVDETYSRLYLESYSEERESALKKYHQLRELFGLLDADTFEALDDATGALVLRFSRDRPQVEFAVNLVEKALNGSY
jgi:hypothetical protein